MDAVHCYRCYSFPSRDLDFYITNCMHMFCAQCQQLCQQVAPPRCIECHQTCKLLKMGPNMPEQVKQMFTSLSEDVTNATRDFTRVVTFQNRQRHNLINGLSKKARVFDKLRDAHSEEKSKKDQYKKQLDYAYRIIQSKESEIMDLKEKVMEKEKAPPTSSASSAPRPPKEMVRVFSDSMYENEKSNEKKETDLGRKKKTMNGKLKEIPPFMKSKSMTTQPGSKQKSHQPPPLIEEDSLFKTPSQPPKTSMGFTTPANPPHMFPHLKKIEAAAQKARQHSQ